MEAKLTRKVSRKYDRMEQDSSRSTFVTEMAVNEDVAKWPFLRSLGSLIKNEDLVTMLPVHGKQRFKYLFPNLLKSDVTATENIGAIDGKAKLSEVSKSLRGTDRNGRSTLGKSVLSNDISTRSQATQTVVRESNTQSDPFSPDIRISEEKGFEILNSADLELTNESQFTSAEYDMIQMMKGMPIAEKLEHLKGREYTVRIAKSVESSLHQHQQKPSQTYHDRIKRFDEKEFLNTILLFKKVHGNVQRKRLRSKNNTHMLKVEKENFNLCRKRIKMRRFFMTRLQAKNTQYAFCRGSKTNFDFSSHTQKLGYVTKIIHDPQTYGEREIPIDILSMQIKQKYSTPIIKSESEIPLLIKRMGEKYSTKAVSHKQQKTLQSLQSALENLNENSWYAKLSEERSTVESNEKARNAAASRIDPFSSPFKLSSASANSRNPIVMVQQIIRGHYAQHTMLKECRRFSATINEFKEAHKLQTSQHKFEMKAQLEQKVKMQAIKSKLKGVVGEILSEALDELSASFEHHTTLQRVEDMIEQADWERSMREMRELGRRQAEELLRRREDILYNQINRCHHQTVDCLLDEIIQRTIFLSARQKVLEEEKIRATYLEPYVEKLEQDFATNTEVVLSLVHHFLVPNVQARLLNQRWNALAARHQYAADKSFHLSVDRAKAALQRFNRI